ncbi:5-formyltetrahydrofolate cyclo-ligase [Peribacillus cavernae]|uniref:5-formyltetrahydrofolate cyclo-ligase n=1 Tax=Peribacillus cavernae TaxID=1674310 RepID=A0A433HJ71_9BACI|nr:5-formyltetrahydrofolate cyclo-ligase [Peribacillus cavernae]MDQ0218310.1 5-formyltetrahydrofolate cyclo-ligase [Peribacillus cavernae]RUQ28408.1 5-formyltetrahydrofolate cyclo-ligase [Peribacillus cavernae]
MTEAKKNLRKQLKAALQKLTESDYRSLSEKIALRLYSLEEWEKARVIGITISNHPEVDTRDIIKQAWEQGKEIAVPKCLPGNKSIQFRKIVSFDQLEKVYFGLWEPIPSITEKVSKDEIDLLVVPGLGFTRSGYRLGFGGGYYDRFLPSYTGPVLSLAFDVQLMPTLPVETHDIPVSKLITPEKVYACNVG